MTATTHAIGSPQWIARLIREQKNAAKPKPKAFRVTYWQFLNLGGIGRIERARFSDRKAAREYVAANSSGMTAAEKRRWKIEPVA